MNVIAKYTEFQAELAVAETFEEIKNIEAKAEVIAEFARRLEIGKEMQNEWGKFIIEIEQKKGKFLEERFPKGRPNNKRSDNPTILATEGITKDESSNSRLLFNNPELVKEAIEKVIDKGKIITPNSVTTEVRKMLIEIQPSNSVFNTTNDNIEWAKWSWNPITGCKHGCNYCYARDIANRYYPHKFEPHFYPERLSAPQNTKIPKGREDQSGYKNVFVCSMSDIGGEWVPKEWVDTIIDIMEKSPQWNYLLLTKNPSKYLEYTFPLNSWLGATADTQKRANEAIRVFKQLKHPVKFLSCEPLEENIILPDKPSIDWLIIGGRSETTGMKAGQPAWEWVESLIYQARKYHIKIYGKPNLKVLPKEYPIK